MSVLGTTVFKVPKLGETGFKIDQVNEAKRKQAQKQLEKEVDATGAEKAYMDNAMGLTGKYKQMADVGYNVFRQSAIEYEKTGSAEAEARMKRAAGELTYTVTAGRSILAEAGKEYINNKANGFKDVSTSAEESSELYSGFAYQEVEVIEKNGGAYVKDGDAFVPITQSTHLQSSVNMNNSFILPRVIKQGTFVNPQSFMKEIDGAITAGSTVEKAEAGVNTLFNNKYENDAAFRSDVLTAYAISNNDGLGMVENPNKINVEKYEEIQALGSNPEIVNKAKEWYQNTILTNVEPLWKSRGATGGLQFGVNIGGGTAKDITFRDNIKVKVTEFDVNEQAQQGEVEAQGYMALTSNLRGKGYADAGSQNKYDIHAIAVVDGKLHAKKVVSEGASFVSIESGRKYTTALEPLLVQEWDALPAETKALAVKRLNEQGLDPNKMISTLSDVSSEEENDVSSQQGFTSDQRQWDNLSNTLKNQGMSDEDIIASIGERPKA